MMMISLLLRNILQEFDQNCWKKLGIKERASTLMAKALWIPSKWRNCLIMQDLCMSEKNLENDQRQLVTNQRQMMEAPHYIPAIVRIPQELTISTLGISVPRHSRNFRQEIIVVATTTRMDIREPHARYSMPKKHPWRNQLVKMFNKQIRNMDMTHSLCWVRDNFIRYSRLLWPHFVNHMLQNKGKSDDVFSIANESNMMMFYGLFLLIVGVLVSFMMYTWPKSVCYKILQV